MHSGPGYYAMPFSTPQSPWFDIRLGITYERDMEYKSGPVVSNVPYPNRKTPVTPPQNYWTGDVTTSEFELLYSCMKGGITQGLNSLGFNNVFNYLISIGATGFD
jgi:hypothetical protein